MCWNNLSDFVDEITNMVLLDEYNKLITLYEDAQTHRGKYSTLIKQNDDGPDTQYQGM